MSFADIILRDGKIITMDPNNRIVDAIAVKDGKKIAIEIETGRSDPIYNIRKNLDYNFDLIHCLTLNRKLKDKILFNLKVYKLKHKKIRIELLSDLLNLDELNLF